MAIISRLLPSFLSAYSFQAASAAFFVPRADETYYDFCGSLGFLSTSLLSLYAPSLFSSFSFSFSHSATGIPTTPTPTSWQWPSSFAPRQLLLTGALILWTTRLGSFLLRRSLKAGGDSRFDQVKHHPAKFAFFWFAQATWVFLVGLPVYMTNTLPSHLHPPLVPLDFLSLSLFSLSFLFEIIADHQKATWRRDKEAHRHEEAFISRGLWALSRHPNYVGEVGLWIGIWALSITSLRTPYFSRWTFVVAGVSPLTTYLLLRYVSGVPPLEKAGDRKFGGEVKRKWEEYKREVPVFWPRVWIHRKA